MKKKIKVNVNEFVEYAKKIVLDRSAKDLGFDFVEYDEYHGMHGWRRFEVTTKLDNDVVIMGGYGYNIELIDITGMDDCECEESVEKLVRSYFQDFDLPKEVYIEKIVTDYEELDKNELIDLLKAYNNYIIEHTDDMLHEEWIPVCIREFFDNEFLEDVSND